MSSTRHSSDQEQALFEAVTKLGLPRFDDQNEENPHGVAPTARNIKDGKRQSSAVAYLGPARQRPISTIIGDAQVAQLILNGKRAEGVRYRKDGNEQTVIGDKIVLSAGVYHSPQILMLSGIGPRAELERHGIPVVHCPGRRRRKLSGSSGGHDDAQSEDRRRPAPSARPLDLQAVFQKRSGARLSRLSYHSARDHHCVRHRRHDRFFLSFVGADQPRQADVASAIRPTCRSSIRGCSSIRRIIQAMLAAMKFVQQVSENRADE